MKGKQCVLLNIFLILGIVAVSGGIDFEGDEKGFEVTKQKNDQDNTEAKIEARILFSGPVAEDVWIYFPPHGIYPEKKVNLTKTNQNGSLGYYNTTKWWYSEGPPPFVKHPDQWDNLVLAGYYEDSEVVIEEIRITYYAEQPREHTYYSFVKTCGNIFDPNNYPVNPTHNVCIDSPPIKIPVFGNSWNYSFADHIRIKREMTMESVLEAYRLERTGEVVNIDFNNLPMSVREATYDMGQSGTLKYSTHQSHHCEKVQCYYLLYFNDNLTADFSSNLNNNNKKDIDEFVNCSDQKCWCCWGIWPSSKEDLHMWPASKRVLARVNFTEAIVKGKMERTGLGTVPFVEVEWDSYTWIDTNRAYTPKPGDMLWRFDNNCLLGHKVRHAMILLGVPYFNNTSGQLMALVFEGPGMALARTRSLSFEQEYLEINQTNCDNFSCLDPETQQEYCTDNISIQNQEEDIECNKTTCKKEDYFCCPRGSYFRQDYYIGESKNPEEWYVSNGGTGQWERIGKGVFSTPIDDDIRARISGEPKNPKLNNLQFADFDGDGKNDVFWRKENGSWVVSYSYNGYDGWNRLGHSVSLEEKLLFGDFGTRKFWNTSDWKKPNGHADVFRITKDGNEVKFWVSYWSGQNCCSSSWKNIYSFTSITHDVSWFYDHIRLADMDGDGLTDVFLKTVDNKWKIAYGGREWVTVKENVPFPISRYRFIDYNNDGKTDVFRILKDGNTGIRTWQISQFISENKMSDWHDIYVGPWEYAVTYLQFGNFDDNETTDIIRKDDDGWYIVYNFDTLGDWTTINITTTKGFNELIFGNFVGSELIAKTDIFAYEKDVFVYEKEVLTGEPDLMITDIWYGTNRIFYKIANQGTAIAGASYSDLYTVTWNGWFNEYRRCKTSDYVKSLGPGENSTEYFAYSWTCSPPADTVQVCVDYNNKIAESDELNNCKKDDVACKPPGLPDLVITKVWNESSVIYYNITNEGTVSAGASYTGLYKDIWLRYRIYEQYQASDWVGPLDPGVTSTEAFTYNWTCMQPIDTTKVCADYNKKIMESNEYNNCL